MRGHISSRLVAELSTALGSQHAALELNWMKDTLRTRPQDTTSTTLDSMVMRRIKGEPLQYILGTQPFGPLDLLVRPPTLIPRPETEDWALRLSKMIQPTRVKPIKVLDLCTGSGCIPLLLCHLWPLGSVHTVGVDISEEALQLAHDNANRCGITVRQLGLGKADNKTEGTSNTLSLLKADILQADFFSNLTQFSSTPFDLITVNPPYIPRAEYDQLPASVKNYEDSRALLGDTLDITGGRGLGFYQSIAGLIRNHCLIQDDGMIALEVGHGQAHEVRELMISKGQLPQTDVWLDPWHKERVVVAWK